MPNTFLKGAPLATFDGSTSYHWGFEDQNYDASWYTFDDSLRIALDEFRQYPDDDPVNYNYLVPGVSGAGYGIFLNYRPPTLTGNDLRYDEIHSVGGAWEDLKIGSTGDMTFAAWIKADDVNIGGLLSVRGSPTDTRYAFFIRPDYTWGLALVNNAMSSGSYPVSYYSGATSISTGVWTHVAVTVDRSAATAYYYENGQLKNTSNIGSDTVNCDQSSGVLQLRIGLSGVNPNTSTFYAAQFIGAIDDVWWVKKFCSANEILQMYKRLSSNN